MSNGLNFNSIMNIASIVGAVMTGGTSLMMQAAMNAVQQVAQNALIGAISNMGLGQGLGGLMMDAFSSAFSAATGNMEAATQQVMDLTSEITDYANAKGDLTQATDDLTTATTDLLTQGLYNELESEAEESGSASGGEGKESWLVAMARALGEAAGEQAKLMIGAAEDMDQVTESGMSKEDQAAEMTKLQAEFQAYSQMFSMLQNALATAVKSIGEGMTAVARKQ